MATSMSVNFYTTCDGCGQNFQHSHPNEKCQNDSLASHRWEIDPARNIAACPRCVAIVKNLLPFTRLYTLIRWQAAQRMNELPDEVIPEETLEEALENDEPPDAVPEPELDQGHR